MAAINVAYWWVQLPKSKLFILLSHCEQFYGDLTAMHMGTADSIFFVCPCFGEVGLHGPSAFTLIFHSGVVKCLNSTIFYYNDVSKFYSIVIGCSNRK